MISKKIKKSSFMPTVVRYFFIILVIVSAISLWRSFSSNSDIRIHKDLLELQQIFDRIQKDCYIYGFDHEKNYIDFLNVITFSNSHVGSMALSFPRNWKGPYLNANPRIQDKLYMILKNKQGYFIVPGDGVRLANGKVVGQDLILDENSDMRNLMQDSGSLYSESGVLAAEIKIGTDFMKSMVDQKLDLLKTID